MELPKIAIPTYELILPSDGRKIKFRSFLVPEEKIFLLTLEGLSSKPEDIDKNQLSMLLAVEQITNNCIISPKIDVSKLPIFDLDYIFVQLRAKSINDKLDLYFAGKTESECAECKKQKHITVDLNSIQVKKDPTHSTKIEITKDVGFIMKYPSFSMYQSYQNKKMSDVIYDLAIDCIQSIYDKSELYDASTYTKEQLTEFYNQLTRKQTAKIKNFFDTMPKLFHRIEWKCSTCGTEQHYDLEKTEDFFE